MATAEILSKDDDDDRCWLCSKNYNRARPSLCHCKHCSKSLCLDCMNEHNNELLQNVSQISHHYNELQQTVQTKQKMIIDETSKSINIVNEYFETYIKQLHVTQQKIITDMEKAKRDAEASVSDIDSQLRELAVNIHGLAKEGIFRNTKMDNLPTQLQRIDQQINTYQITKTENLKMIIPEFSLQFQCLSDVVTDTHQSLPIEEIETVQPVENESPPQTVTFETPEPVVPVNLQQKPIKSKRRVRSSLVKTPISMVSGPSQNESRDLCPYDVKVVSAPVIYTNSLRMKHRITSCNVDRMASDGENILYTSFYDGRPDLIIYCHFNDYNGTADRWRYWNQSRISNMIWWGSVQKFVCGTKVGIYTVDCTDGKLRITHVIQSRSTDIIMASNTNNLFTWANPSENILNGIDVFSTSFKFIRKINFNFPSVGPSIDRCCSFCTTDNVMALIYIHLTDNCKVFRVNFFDFNMNNFNTILLGRCDNRVEIRTNGKDKFFVTTGRLRLHIVSPSRKKNTINLENIGERIAVIDSHRIAISNGHPNMELITY